jgi:hypothetical protein
LDKTDTLRYSLYASAPIKISPLIINPHAWRCWQIITPFTTNPFKDNHVAFIMAKIHSKSQRYDLLLDSSNILNRVVGEASSARLHDSVSISFDAQSMVHLILKGGRYIKIVLQVIVFDLTLCFTRPRASSAGNND